MHHKTALLGIIFFAGFLISSYIGITASLVCCALSGAAALAAHFIIKNKTAVLALTGSAAAFLFYAVYSSVYIAPVTSLYGKTCDMTATVLSVSLPDNDTFRVTAEGTADGVPVRFTVSCPDSGIETGDEIGLSVKFTEPVLTATYNGNYSYADRIFVRASAKYIDVVRRHSGFSLRSALAGYSYDLRCRVREELTGDEGGLMLAMCFGDKSRLSTSLASAVTGSGLSHMTAVSGMHLSLIVTAIMSVLGLTGLKKHRFAGFAAVVVLTALFAVFFDFTASVCRSGLMLVICSAAGLFRRRLSPPDSLGAAVIIILLIEPCACRDAGLILSACGTLGAGSAAPAVLKLFRRHFSLTRYADIFVVGICASLCTLPASAVIFGRFSLLSALASAAVYPMFLGVMILALLLAFSGGLLAPLVLLPAGILLKAMILVIRFCSGFRYSSISLDGERLVPFLIISAVFIAAAAPVAAGSKHRSRYIAVTAAVCVCTLAVGVTAEKVAHSGETRIMVYSDGNNCLMSVSDDTEISAYSTEINRKLSSAAYNAMAERGTDSLGLLCVLAEKKHGSVYSRAFDDIPAIEKRFLDNTENVYDVGGRYQAEIYEDAVRMVINGVSVIMSEAAAAPVYGGQDIAIYSGYKKSVSFAANGITVLCDKRYADEDNAYNAYFTKTEIRISPDGKVFIKQGSVTTFS